MLLTAIIIALCTVSVFLWLFRGTIAVYYSSKRKDQRAKRDLASEIGVSYAYINESINNTIKFAEGKISCDEYSKTMVSIEQKYPEDAAKSDLWYYMRASR